METTTAPADERDQLDAEAEQTKVSVTPGVTPNVMPETPIVTGEPIKFGERDTLPASGSANPLVDPQVLKKRAQAAERQRRKRQRDREARAWPEAGGRGSEETLAPYVHELEEIAAALRDKVLAAGERAQYRLRADVIAKLILAKEKSQKEKSQSKSPVLPPWFSKR